jgi:hypothetical protein
MIVERPAEGKPAALAEEMSQDSKAEKSIEVEKPPSMRPINRIGMEGMAIHAQDRVYVMQKTRHSFFRPLFELFMMKIPSKETKWILTVGPPMPQP